jgi:NADH:ubiquinone oxidoreductase subunit 2 (subunit N)
LKGAYRWLTLAILGLLSAGVGTVIFAPLAALAAVRAQDSLQSHAERVGSTVILIVAFALFVIGVFFSILFVLHWLG